MHGIDQVTVSKKMGKYFFGENQIFFPCFALSAEVGLTWNTISCQLPLKECPFLPDFCPLCSGLGPPDASIFGSVHLWELLLAST